MKPVASGAQRGAFGLRNDDALALAKAAGHDLATLDARQYAVINPYCFEPAIAPHIAAVEAAATVDLARIVAEVYGEYQRRLRSANAFDFDDLIGETVAVLQSHPQIAQHYRRRFRHVLVDEYQDTNHAQYLIVKALASRFENICVVGDDAQSIYSFRGANIRNILNFQNDYPDAALYKLEQNYRSTKRIVSAANTLISHNKEQHEREGWQEHNHKFILGWSDNQKGKRPVASPKRQICPAPLVL